MLDQGRKMGERGLGKYRISHLTGSRAAKITAAVVSVFLCLLTLFEFTALHLEWEIPALALLTGGSEGLVFREYRKEEMALDSSAVNEPFCVSEEQVSPVRDEKSESKHTVEKLNPEKNEERQEPEDHMYPAATEELQPKDPDDSRQYGESDQEAMPYFIRINRKQNCITVYSADQNGEYKVPYKAMICSTGLYNATPRGTFHLSTKYLWRELYGGVYGQYATRITGGILFHSVPYYKKSKNTLCTDKYNKLGQQASMGCVRLTVEDALWISENCPEGTEVEIYEDEDPGPLGKPEAVIIDTNDSRKSWDPTDPDETNPWNQNESGK